MSEIQQRLQVPSVVPSVVPPVVPPTPPHVPTTAGTPVSTQSKSAPPSQPQDLPSHHHLHQPHAPLSVSATISTSSSISNSLSPSSPSPATVAPPAPPSAGVGATTGAGAGAASVTTVKQEQSEKKSLVSTDSATPSNPVHPNAKTITHVNNGTTTTKTNITSPVCRNCKTQTTPLWRRDETGQVLCNACGLFLKLHGRPRPISLKTDTIKSRNRIKSQNGNGTPNSQKSTAPNTPELKSKDSSSSNNLNLGNKLGSSSGKKSPKSSKKHSKSNSQHSASTGGTSSDPNYSSLTPLLPASGNSSTTNTPTGHQTGTTPHQPFPHPYSNHPHHHHLHLPPHLQAASSHIVQPLHYPSSTPTQFAPGSLRITSPLLLSNSSSISNTRTSSANKLSSIQQAAGALEHMSAELGPSATFKFGNNKNSTGSQDGRTISGVSLMSGGVKREPKSSLLGNSSSIFSSVQQPPKLPALGQRSPNLDAHSRSSTPGLHAVQSPMLPPLHHAPTANSNTTASTTGSGSGSGSKDPLSGLPPFPSLNATNSTGYTPSPGDRDGNEHNNYNNNNNNGNNNNNNNNGNNNNNNNSSLLSNHEVTLLKTRISELELVNDLYRTRIMELEAMEQAARLRESSMRKRLDEVLSLRNLPVKNTTSSVNESNTNKNVSSSTTGSSIPPSTAPSTAGSGGYSPHVNLTPSSVSSSVLAQIRTPAPTSQPAPPSLPASSLIYLTGANPTTTTPAGTAIQPPTFNRFDTNAVLHQLSPGSTHQPPPVTTLPSIRSVTDSGPGSNSGSGPNSSPIVLPSLKRENDDGLHEVKKPKLG
ncbi:uncharacterized protein RJT21DRAFT_3039 [Scheffersomyces amazonensis]|uniref:uncharacterized protein n=1 Tax=Scheffersomyces amazonensis TaxID=1078765 RepID=UPI00315CAF78